MESPPLILDKKGFHIFAVPEKLVAYTNYGEFRAERTFPEIEDLFSLSLRGLISRAQEFYNELTKQ